MSYELVTETRENGTKTPIYKHFSYDYTDIYIRHLHALMVDGVCSCFASASTSTLASAGYNFHEHYAIHLRNDLME